MSWPAQRTGGRCEPARNDIESTLDASCESSIGGSVITIKRMCKNIKKGGNAGTASRP